MGISTEVGELSNFERYEHELSQGFLHWGYIHSSKFWAENVMKFEQNDWKALNMLLDLVQSPDTDATTLAVAFMTLVSSCNCIQGGKSWSVYLKSRGGSWRSW